MVSSTQSLADQVYSLIKGEILRGDLTFGEKIREDDLAARFGVSRTPVREAIRRLAEYGLVKIAPRSHAAIARIEESEARDIAEIRINLESFAIDHIIPALFAEKLPLLSHYAAACQYSLSVGERDKSFELDSLFHITLTEIAGNSTLSELYRHLDARIQLLRVKQGLDEKTLIPFISQHGELLALLKAGRNQEAKDLIRFHVLHEQ